MSNKKEVIKYLFNSYEDITTASINNTLSEEYYDKRMHSGNDMFSECNFLNERMYLYKSIIHNKHRISSLNDALSKLNGRVLDIYRDLYTRLDRAIALSKGSLISDKSDSSLTKSVLMQASSMPINTETTNAIIEDGKIIGVRSGSVILTDDNLANSEIPLKNISVILTEPNGVYGCYVANNDGSVLNEDSSIVNKMTRLIFSGHSSNRGNKELEITIDRKEYSRFNNIQILTKLPYMYTIYKGNDGISFEKINDKKSLTDSLNISVKDSTDRYIKIVVHLSNPTSSSKKGFDYTFETDGIFVCSEKYESSAVFESTDISIDQDCEYIGIDTCDNYQDRAVDIRYSISINGNPYKAIKPIRKMSPYDYGLRSIIPVVDFYDMKIGTIKSFESDGKRNIFQSEISDNLLNSNEFKYFNATDVFSNDGKYVTVYGILYTDIEYTFNSDAMLNGIPVKGYTKIYAGINKIEFPSYLFKEMFNIRKVKLMKITDSGIINIDFENGTSLSFIADQNNGFIDSIKIFGHECILGQDITGDVELVNTGSGSLIATNTNCENLLILTRNRMSRLETVKIKIDMRSIDNYSRPEITRVIFKVA